MWPVIVWIVMFVVVLAVLAVTAYPVFAAAWLERKKRIERKRAVEKVLVVGHQPVSGSAGSRGIEIRYRMGLNREETFTVTSYDPGIWGIFTTRQNCPPVALFELPALPQVPYRLATPVFTGYLDRWVAENGGRASLSQRPTDTLV